MVPLRVRAVVGWAGSVILSLLNSPLAQAEDRPEAAFFRHRVAPILSRCVRCHGEDKSSNGLKLTTRELALKGGESGPALVPRDPPKSLLYAMVSSRKMPPRKPLSKEEIEALHQWIAGGAAWTETLTATAEVQRAGSDWWSLQKLVRPMLPAVKAREWVHNPVDTFILASLETQGLGPSPPADRATLLRRASFDLLGLPPAPAEIDAFVHDPAPDAYERLLDRLLASPHYGERWGRNWLDLARFGESQGFERDKIRDHAWPYRDYVIESFNADKPYPQFVKEQIVGDRLDPVTREGVIATGFLVAGPWDEVGAMQQSAVMRARVREEELEDILSVVGQTFLGLTVNCARCHDHKFDPIPQTDYYRLKAAFDGVRPGDRPALAPDELRARDERIASLNVRITGLEQRVAALERSGRENVLRQAGRPAAAAGPLPMARWTFELDARDSHGDLHGTLHGGAVVANGRLLLNGKDAFVQTAPLSADVREKTLEAWVALPTLTQRGGGFVSLESKDGGVFDAIVFGEREPMKWIAGSNSFFRTRDLPGLQENAKPGDLIHLAISYQATNRIAVYRNGKIYGEGYTPVGQNAGLQTYAAGTARLLLGLRHTGAGNGFVAGEIEEARLYNRALTADEVAASFRAGVSRIPLDQILAALSAEERKQHAALLRELRRQREALSAAHPLPLVYAANPRPPESTFLLVRGDVEKKGDRMTAGGLSAVQAPSPELGLPPDAPEHVRRLKLAEWITHTDNPLTARVLVNRVWQHHFGRGLVSTPNDFGFNGERPSHPELLDWLACEFIARGWSMKHLHKLIMLSTTYRQSARLDAKAAAVDADNRLLWRFTPRRLEGEAVRDAMLAVSGQLNLTMGGPAFRPFDVTIFNSSFYTLVDKLGPDFNRRTVYRINVNSAKDPLLESLDCPDPSVKAPRRNVTTTPLQALGLMNNSFVLRQARHCAERVRKEAGDDLAPQVDLVFRFALGRAPTSAELTRALPLARDFGLQNVCWVLLNASEFLYLR
jgi:cytochrome c553